MSTAQSTLFDAPEVEEETARPERGLITRRALNRSILACYRVEDEIWQRLHAAGCSDQSDAEAIRAALLPEYTRPPEWCELAAWQRICRSFRDWSQTFGNLRRFVELRRKRDDE